MGEWGSVCQIKKIFELGLRDEQQFSMLKIEKVSLGAEAEVHWTEMEESMVCLGDIRCLMRLEEKVHQGQKVSLVKIVKSIVHETRGPVLYPSGNKEPEDSERGKAWLSVRFRKILQQQCRRWTGGGRNQKGRVAIER